MLIGTIRGRVPDVSQASWTVDGLRVDRISLQAKATISAPLRWQRFSWHRVPPPRLMAPAWDREALDCPHVNLSMTAERSHISSAGIDPEIRAGFGKRQQQRAGLGLEGWRGLGI